jgi:hypothetical protein
MLKLALKPLVGGVAALTLYLLLSWQILTGVQVTSGGTFLLVGFLAGFSERYFLRLLSAAEDSSTNDSPRDRAGRSPSQADMAVSPWSSEESGRPSSFTDESPRSEPRELSQ